MTRKQFIEKDKIKNYWETRAPQVWYSDKEEGTLEWFNELEYKRYHCYYEYIPKIAEFEHHYGEQVLEIGVGLGTDIIQFAKHGAVVSGIDLTENAVEMTKRHFKLKGLKYKILEIQDAEKLDFNSKTFDLVYSFGVLHHMPNTDIAINEIHRVLKDEGKAIVMLYARGWKHYFKRIFIHGILFGKLFKYGYSKLVNLQTEVQGSSPLTYVFTKKEIKKMFSIFGDVEITRYRLGEYFDYAPYKTRKVPQFIKNILDLFTAERFLGENFIIKAVKTNKKPRYSFFKTLLKP
ncbi:class I SAM-dependent methyltransferase [Omnitrophica bacterium]|nr:class I SAM-dependent methyltransferase [Candidatus Omnitrophota bacterium]